MIYFVLVDRFANGDPTNDHSIDLADPSAFHGGDIRGVIDHLDDIQRLGADTVWLSPVTTMRTTPFFQWGAFHGYWVEDLQTIAPRFGTEAELVELSGALHKRHMRLLLDMVYNHVAPDGVLTTTQPDWFHDPAPIVDWADPKERVTGQVHGLPDLAQEREPVYEYLLQSSMHWISTVHPDGFRVDAVRHMPTGFLARLGSDIKAVAGSRFQMLGEVFDGDSRVLAHTQWSAQLDAVFDFPLHYAMVDTFCDDGPPGALGAVFAQDGRFADPNGLVTFLDNHDLPRILAACHGDPDRVARALTLQYAARGKPAVTYGTEAGLFGMAEPANRADMVFKWNDTGHHIRTLAAARRRHSALTTGVTRDIALDDTLYAFARVSADESLLVVVNSGDGPRKIHGHTVKPHAVEVFPTRRPPPARPSLARVSAHGAPLSPGDELRLVGAGDTLGNWNPAFGVPLPTDISFAHQVQAFKLVIRHTDGTMTWEDRPNRYWLPGTRVLPLRWDDK